MKPEIQKQSDQDSPIFFSPMPDSISELNLFSQPSPERFPDRPLELSEIKQWFVEFGCSSLYIKEMAWNHDSKRQVYLSTDLSPFNIFPNHIEDCPPMPTGLVATKKNKPKGSDRIFGHLDLWWITQDLTIDNAKFAKLIFYPQYPEVRLSGFVRGTKSIPSRFLREKSGETYENRLLFL
ncbi:MAG: hypothetical protein GY818_20230, partial [Planctomycetaceae bacterium]|nr:hypothetical protein [Planctomycetaceae bacterium]